MRKLLFFMGSLVGVACLLLASARLVGAAQPNPDRGWFTYPDGQVCDQPCLFGVIPGLTTTREAARLVRSHPLTQAFTLISENPFRIEVDGEAIVMITFNGSDDGLIDEITVRYYQRHFVAEDGVQSPPPLPVGELLRAYGNPDFIQFTRGGFPTIGFVNQRVLAMLNYKFPSQQIRLATQLNRLTLFRENQCPVNAFTYNFPYWQGLAGIGQYAGADTRPMWLRKLNSAGIDYAPCRTSVTP